MKSVARSTSARLAMALLLSACDGMVSPDGGPPDPRDPLQPFVLDAAKTPGRNFDLTHWKLTLPTDRGDGKPLELYPYSLLTYTDPALFFTHPQTGAMVFKLDSGQGVTTTNSSHVRNELRELMDGWNYRSNWLIAGRHRMDVEMALVHTTISQVTVAQIHGIGPNGESKDPLLRVVVENGDLKAKVAMDAAGNDSSFVLKRGVRTARFSCSIVVQDGRLIITVDGSEVLNRSISYWTHYNYFKQGLYPQASSGTSELHVYKLRVTHE